MKNHGDNPTTTLRQGTPADLDAVNQLISRAIATWTLSDRVKRLSLPSYQYDAVDYDHLGSAGSGANNRHPCQADPFAAEPPLLPACCGTFFGFEKHCFYL